MMTNMIKILGMMIMLTPCFLTVTVVVIMLIMTIVRMILLMTIVIVRMRVPYCHGGVTQAWGVLHAAHEECFA